jgi:hypothetical protein
MFELRPHHVAWLSVNPHRSETWLREMFRHGFQIHHLDGDHANNDPQNLLLINHQDHMSLHGVVKRVRPKTSGKKRGKSAAALVPPPQPISAKSFQSWMDAMSLTAQEVAEALDVHPNTVTRYRQEGGPPALALACRALFHKLEPWT